MFGLNGIGGMLIATALLLSILGFLGYNAVVVQNAQASNFYQLVNEKDIQMIAPGQRDVHVVDAK